MPLYRRPAGTGLQSPACRTSRGQMGSPSTCSTPCRARRQHVPSCWLAAAGLRASSRSASAPFKQLLEATVRRSALSLGGPRPTSQRTLASQHMGGKPCSTSCRQSVQASSRTCWATWTSARVAAQPHPSSWSVFGPRPCAVLSTPLATGHDISTSKKRLYVPRTACTSCKGYLKDRVAWYALQAVQLQNLSHLFDDLDKAGSDVSECPDTPLHLFPNTPTSELLLQGHFSGAQFPQEAQTPPQVHLSLSRPTLSALS